MVDTKSLRIGNRVYSIYHKQYFTVSEIYEDSICPIEYPNIKIFSHALAGIELTPSILTEWCGFKQMNEKVFRREHLSISLNLDLSGGTGHTNYSHIGGVKISNPYSLHQLQNLIFVLENREFEIKLPEKVKP